ncbi:hypothetical protein [Aequorivita sediminis]|uniref:hypothetical protein n=1 Tax=Aequorivita sediminis TaxID=3073653 RepID=UPI0028B00660|nr:hypothetical protein [Aequorivita sp. F6058]
MKFIIPILIAISFLFSCGNNSEVQKAELPNTNMSIIFGDTTYTYPQLIEPAKEQAVKWGVLEDLIQEAKSTNGSNYRDLREHAVRLREISDSLFKKIPDTLNTNPINSRLLVLKTRSELLYQTSHQDNIDSLNIQESVKELNIAVENLITHLNEKFLKDKIDYQRKEDEENELKKQERFRDSIFELELQDKKN